MRCDAVSHALGVRRALALRCMILFPRALAREDDMLHCTEEGKGARIMIITEQREKRAAVA